MIEMDEMKGRGKRGLLRVVFGRTMFFLLFIALQLAFFFWIYVWLDNKYQAWGYGSFALISAILTIHILNEKQNASFKMAWLIPVLLFPVFGTLFYVFVQLQMETKIFAKRIAVIIRQEKSLPGGTHKMENTTSAASPITGHTGLICLLGSLCDQSVSPMMHNASFEALGLDYRYLAFDVNEETLPTAVAGLKVLGARGFNLTMPDKNLMVSLCDELSTAARIIGAVNTVVNEDGRLVGHNTDGIGYMQSVKDAGYDIIGKKMTLLGAGGAATAILVQAALDGLKEISVFVRPTSRFYDRLVHTVEELTEITDCRIKICDFSDANLLKKELADSAILTNGTSVGMAPHEDTCPVPENLTFPKDLIVSDIIYNPRETKLLTMAKNQGNPFFNGSYMLLYQGAEAFRLWTGKEMPVEKIKKEFFSDPFYSKSNLDHLRRVIAALNAGNGISHELITDEK